VADPDDELGDCNDVGHAPESQDGRCSKEGATATLGEKRVTGIYGRDFPYFVIYYYFIFYKSGWSPEERLWLGARQRKYTSADEKRRRNKQKQGKAGLFFCRAASLCLA